MRGAHPNLGLHSMQNPVPQPRFAKSALFQTVIACASCGTELEAGAGTLRRWIKQDDAKLRALLGVRIQIDADKNRQLQARKMLRFSEAKGCARLPEIVARDSTVPADPWRLYLSLCAPRATNGPDVESNGDLSVRPWPRARARTKGHVVPAFFGISVRTNRRAR